MGVATAANAASASRAATAAVRRSLNRRAQRPSKGRWIVADHCCEQMAVEATRTCPTHGNRSDCPDCLIRTGDTGDEFGIYVHDGGGSWIAIAFCPWCGTNLRAPAKADLSDIADPQDRSEPPPEYRLAEWINGLWSVWRFQERGQWLSSSREEAVKSCWDHKDNREAVIAGQDREVAALREWKAREQQALISACARLMNTGHAKGPGLIEAVDAVCQQLAAVTSERDQLWVLLDDIDTLDDVVKDDDKVFRVHARQLQERRHAIVEGSKVEHGTTVFPNPGGIRFNREPGTGRGDG